MGNASGRSFSIKHGHMRSNHHSQKHMHHHSKHMRTHRHHYKNRTHKRRRYGGGLSPKVKSNLSKVVNASSLEESASSSSPSVTKSGTNKLKKVRKFVLAGVGSTRKLVHKTVAKHVAAARNTRLDVEEAEARAAASKLPSKGKRSPGKSAQAKLDMQEMARKRKESDARKEEERKKAAAFKKANEESFSPHQQTFGISALPKYIPEEEEEVQPSTVKPLTPAQRKKMNDAVKKSMKELAVLEEEDEE